VDGVRRRLPGGRQQTLDRQVRFSRRGLPDLDRHVRHRHVRITLIGRRVDGDRLDAQLAACPDHPHRDLSAVGHEHASGLVLELESA
jgi:hypothetical protein